MADRLRVTEHAEGLLDDLVYHLIFRLKNDQAAAHLFDEIEKIYVRLEENPYQFLKSRDAYLNRLGYREAVLTDMDYVIVFRIEEDLVYVLGIFHQLENYRRKI